MALWDSGVPGDYMAIFLADMPPCPLDHPNSTPKFRGWRKAGASTFFLFQEGLVTRHPSDLVLVVKTSRLLPSSLLWV